MKTIPLITSLLAAGFFLPVAALAADPQPTLAETITFITDKFKDLPGAVFQTEKDAKREIYGMKVDWFNAGTLCVLVSRRSTGQGGPAEEDIMRYQLPLASLSTDVEVVPSPSTGTSLPAAYGVVISSAPPAQGTASEGLDLCAGRKRQCPCGEKNHALVQERRHRETDGGGVPARDRTFRREERAFWQLSGAGFPAITPRFPGAPPL